MMNKNERTLEKYIKAGAEMRLVKTLASRAFVDVGGLIKVSDQNKLRRALNLIDEICSTAEDNMYRDHPGLSDEYTSVFYGVTNTSARNNVDRDILSLAGNVAESWYMEDI